MWQNLQKLIWAFSQYFQLSRFSSKTQQNQITDKRVWCNLAKKRQINLLSVVSVEKIKIFENISWEQLEKVEANKLEIEGLFISQDYMRVYNYGNIFSHLLGYINKPNES